MIVQAKGPQNITLSPPINKCGFKSVIKEKKSKFNPMANGINPKTAVKAVNKTGRKRDLPDSIITSFISSKINHRDFLNVYRPLSCLIIVRRNPLIRFRFSPQFPQAR